MVSMARPAVTGTTVTLVAKPLLLKNKFLIVQGLNRLVETCRDHLVMLFHNGRRSTGNVKPETRSGMLSYLSFQCLLKIRKVCTRSLTTVPMSIEFQRGR